MIRKLYLIMLNSFLILSCLKERIFFIYSISRVKEIQEKLLFKIIIKNKNTLFGIKNKFSSIKTIKDFQQQTPVSTYESYERYITLIMMGKKKILTNEDVIILEPTSGSTAPSKYIPYTKSLIQEFQKGIKPWIFDIYFKRLQLLSGTAYWSITPSNNKSIKSKVPIGFEDDTNYFGFPQKLIIKSTLAVPSEVGKISEIDVFRYVTLLFLLKDKNLRFISVWNPTFLTLLMEPLLIRSDSLIGDIQNGTLSPPGHINPKIKNELLKELSSNNSRAKEITEIINHRRNKKAIKNSLYEDIWPNLQLISCWVWGNSAHYLKDLKAMFPKTEIQGKGLIATEGFVSFPLSKEEAPVLSVSSHFFEFIDIENNVIKLAHELELNKKYSVLITTSGGFFRYKLHDIVKVVGFKKQAALLQFLGKEGYISDLFGEKINQMHVYSIFEKLFKKYRIFARFYMLAPCKNTQRDMYYVIFMEPAQKISKDLMIKFRDNFEKELQKNYHYSYCRKLSQLKMIRLFFIRTHGMKNFIDECQRKGQKLGNIKPPILNKNFGWENKFDGKFIE